MHILIKMPTRERPDRAAMYIRDYLHRASGKHRITMLVSIDNDDEATQTAVARGVFNFDPRIVVVSGDSAGKVHAINRDIERVPDFDILIATADDMLPVATNYDDRIVADMWASFPDLDGAIHYPEGNHDRNLCTLPVMGREFYKRFGCVYHPSYRSLWCDNEQQDVGYSLGRMTYVNSLLIEHRHPSTGKNPHDQLYQRNETFFRQDEDNYRARKARNFDLSPLLFSVMVLSVQRRWPMMNALLAKLTAQINAAGERESVEIICHHMDGETLTIGRKRNECLQRARGKFVAFFDDDDKPSDDYIARIMHAIRADQDVDCIGIEGIYTRDGQNPQKFTHSIKHAGWFEQSGVHYRTPNHWNPVRLEHARAAGFPTEPNGKGNWGEDREYSERLANMGLLKRETYIDAPIYHYLQSDSTSISGPRSRATKG